MLEKPRLQDDTIISCLRERYALPICGVDFLPLGNDATAWVYGVRTDESCGQRYFLKVKRGSVYEPALFVPRYLKDQGIEQVVAPLPTAVAGGAGGDERALWAKVHDAEFVLILYPFIEGRTGMEIGMSDEQWVEFGTVLKRIHSTRLHENAGRSAEQLAQMKKVRKEGFSPPWSGMVSRLDAQIQANDYDRYDGSFEKELASFWREKRKEIRQIVDRTEELGRMLEGQSNEFVLCHADIHTANILLDQQDKMFIVDWDETILAPKERDLMFVLGEKADLFFKGYGKTKINALALAYYRYEWVVQEIGDYGERVFLMKDIGDDTKRDAVEGFIELFEAGDVVESAYASDILAP